MNNQPSLSELFSQLSKISNKSNCLRARVSAMIIDKNRNILSTAFNTTPLGVQDSKVLGFCNKEKHNIPSGTGYDFCRSIHAEQMAILQLGIQKTIGCTILVYGHSFVCIQCQKYIVQAQISKVYLLPTLQDSIIEINPINWIKELSTPDPLRIL